MEEDRKLCHIQKHWEYPAYDMKDKKTQNQEVI